MMVELVTSNSDRKIEQEHARQALDYATRQCIGNILRVMAGAGDVHMTFQQIHGLMEAYATLINRKPDVSPSFTFGEILRSYEPRAEDGRRLLADPHTLAQDDIMRYALRIVAANLIGQRTQAARSESAMWQAIWGRVRELQR